MLAIHLRVFISLFNNNSASTSRLNTVIQMTKHILPREFYERNTLDVSKQLLGKVLKFSHYRGIITEIEAYIGQDDPACHAAKGYTPRNSVMFGIAGFSYIYFIYGMYYCLNIVTEKEGFPAAILIRGIELIEPVQLTINGPGKLCKYLSISKANNAFDLTTDHNFCVYNKDKKIKYIRTPRIGIKKGTDKLWRFKIIP
ncbi:3-methyladenine DNA glycosylase [Candidatus Liberibacter solanacearum CLso-ZC1]|uniref:Putative 3-methyladenine DNA glycosylase n=1 Tax=Liberibacter solanacearum (strain CLso-ZC1) TaxID=658172 RepID=E4UE56_LIBSC|nr:DNA-3-methyladenine glycosylase [Candidatus Liberibacter solanacearum]ADR52884.1 3-methyladenine DNA glycosylase [Candidatus Liberibacter solanacearum CLso-ZC1]